MNVSKHKDIMAYMENNITIPSDDINEDSDDNDDDNIIENNKNIEQFHEINNNITNDIDDFAFTRKIPVSHQIDLMGHTKAISCISIDSSGNRVVTGCMDYFVKIYDFGGMDSRHRAFKSFEPNSGYPVVSVSHSPTGDRFVIGLGSPQPIVYDRDGTVVITFTRGDMYIRDMTNTKGHVMEVTCVQWHPTDKNIILTSSLDGTLRIWDLLGEAHFGNLTNKHVLKIRSLTASASTLTRIGATCCSFSSNGKYILGGATDGSIHIWQERKTYSRPDILIKLAHSIDKKPCSITAIHLLNDNATVISRGDDNSIKIWNSKKPNNPPVKIFNNMYSFYPTANFALSPDESILVCGNNSGVSSSNNHSNSDSSNDKKSLLCFYDLNQDITSPCMQLGISDGAIIYLKWAASTNQIFCSTSKGITRVFYDPRLSKKGALQSAGRTPRREKDPSDYALVGNIIIPDEVPIFKTNDPRENRKRNKEERELRMPEKPLSHGPGSKINTSFFFTKYVTEGKKTANSLRDEDPREALLKLDSKTKEDPMFLGKAYKDSQPVTILNSMTFEQEQEEFKKRQKLQLDKNI